MSYSLEENGSSLARPTEKAAAGYSFASHAPHAASVTPASPKSSLTLYEA